MNEPLDLIRAVNGVLLPGFQGTTLPDWLVDAARKGLAGVVLFAQNTPDLSTTAELTRRLHELEPQLLIALDEEGGDVSRLEAADGSSLPGAAALGQVDDMDLTAACGRALGRVLALVGVDLDLAPVLDVASDSRNPVIGVRSFGPDPALVARHGTAFAQGLHDSGVATCAKHYPGHGDTRADSHVELPVVDAPLDVLVRRELEPFSHAIGAGVLDAVMTAHVVVPALGNTEPASLSRPVYDRLRGAGFDGPAITDALDMRAVSGGSSDPRGVGEAAVRALSAGADLLCLGTTAARDDAALFLAARGAIVGAVEAGRLPAARLVEAAARLDRLRSVALPRPRALADAATVGAVTELAALGEEVARRAVRARPGASAATCRTPSGVVDLRVRLDHAAGRVSRRVQETVAARWPSFDPDGPLVAVTRDPVPGSVEHGELARLWSARRDVVVIHTGVPGAADEWFGSLGGGGPHVVLACGTGRANAQAAVSVLADLLERLVTHR